jgi:adenylosuccinate synthase
MKITGVDICCGLAWGDEAKGKIVSELARTNRYNFVCRWAGGNNAGHTVFVDGIKFKTHLIPCGVFYNIPSIIGPDCVVNIDAFFAEIKYLQDHNFNVSLIKISPKAHIVTNEHIAEDIAKIAIVQGTTSKGIAPCYGDKYRRVGTRVSEVDELREFLWDEKLHGKILCEGAQGFWLDINQGNYPYTTSSVTLPYGACSLGFSPKLVRNIYGAAKIYDTRSGIDPEFPECLFENKELNAVGEAGEEYGVTTGRKRKIKWLNLKRLIEAIHVTGTTHLIISKTDVLLKVGLFKLFDMNGILMSFHTMDQMIFYLNTTLNEICNLQEIIFSNNPYTIESNHVESAVFS